MMAYTYVSKYGWKMAQIQASTVQTHRGKARILKISPFRVLPHQGRWIKCLLACFGFSFYFMLTEYSVKHTQTHIHTEISYYTFKMHAHLSIDAENRKERIKKKEAHGHKHISINCSHAHGTSTFFFFFFFFVQYNKKNKYNWTHWNWLVAVHEIPDSTQYIRTMIVSTINS